MALFRVSWGGLESPLLLVDTEESASTSPPLPILSLAPELVIEILAHIIEDTVLTLESEENDTEVVRPCYTPPINPSNLSSPWGLEFQRLLRQRWLRTEKVFDHAWYFCAVHIICLAQKGGFNIKPSLLPLTTQTITLPDAMRPHPALRLHGLESVYLDLECDDYFALFGVKLPPFEEPGNRMADPDVYGAATFLKYTEKLTVNFGSRYRWNAHPWYELCSTEWDVEDEEGCEPRYRANTCTLGLIIDWILTYAWHSKYIQHIPSVALSGDVQPWVLEKWTQVFNGTHPRQSEIGSIEEIRDLEHIGEADANAEGREWRPEQHYPPVCRCEFKCEGGVSEDVEAEARGWTLLEDVEPGDWYDRSTEPEGNW
ncbi:hypothetical protein K458DRAFT_382991 [Lentithecium fluviatile CBS 122367]|uniref:Uncharacterized protein n=1 Tax=Lentithecium fluviatile CBS 122367 TaxID=1168545 RepID=A0A6G1JI86_9PLEO|nr:hypothetical protein K458DRAFT_382991 [Lentithecium fluviatile CBS 122367]